MTPVELAPPPSAQPAPEAKVAGNFFALASGDALARLIAFCAAWYIARKLGPGAFGAVAFATAVLLYFQNLSECGIDLLGVRHIAEDVARIESVAPAILGARWIVSSTLAVAVFAVGLALGEFGVLPALDARVFAFYGLTLVAIGPNTKWIHLGLQDTRPVAVARTLGESTMLALVLVFVAAEGDVTRVPLFQLCGDVLACTILFVWLRKKRFAIRLALDWKLVKPIFARAWPLVANVLLGLTIYNSDLIFLRYFKDRETVGRYAAAYQLISFLFNVAAAYSLSFLSALTRLQSDRARRNALYHDSAATMFAVAIPIAVGGSMLAPLIIGTIFEANYAASGPILAILLWTLPFTVSKEVDLIALVAGGREKTVMNMTAAAVAINFVLNIVLIPTYGMAGAAWATLATEILRALIASWCARRLDYPLTGVARFWRTGVAATAMAASLWLASPTSIFVGVPLGAAIFAIVLAAVGGVKFERGSLPALRV